MPNPVQTADDAQMAQQIAQLAQQNPALVSAIAKAAVGSQAVKLNLPYFSRVAFTATGNTVGAVTTYTLNARTQVQAFSYGQTDSMAAAGMGRNATAADTNLQEGRKTKGGATIRIDGIALYPIPAGLDSSVPNSVLSDQVFLAWLLSQCSLDVVINSGETTHNYGPPIQVSAPGGLQGQGQQAILPPPLAASYGQVGFGSNGWPMAGNLYRFKEPYFWTPSGTSDGSWQVFLTNQQALTLQATARAAAAGVQATTPPANLYQEFLVFLASNSAEPRGVNA